MLGQRGLELRARLEDVGLSPNNPKMFRVQGLGFRQFLQTILKSNLQLSS